MSSIDALRTSRLDRLSPRRRAYLALGLGVFCVAWSATLIKFAGVPGPASAFYRLFIASAVLLPWQARHIPFQTRRRAVLVCMAGGVLFALNAALWNTSLLLTSVANSTLLANTAPLWVGLGTLLLFHQRLPVTYWLAMVIAFSGMAVIVGRDVLAHPQVGLGDALALGAALLYTSSLLVTQRVRAHLNALVVTALMASAGVAIVLALCLALGIPLSSYSLRSWLALLAVGLVSHVGGVVSVNYALPVIGAAVTSVTMLLQAILSATIAAIVLGESLTPAQLLGGALVLGGVYLAHRQSAGSPPAAYDNAADARLALHGEQSSE